MANLSPPPLREPLYINGVMSPTWWRWFSDLFSRAVTVGTSVGIDDTTPPTIEQGPSESELLMSASLAFMAGQNDDLKRRLDDALAAPVVQSASQADEQYLPVWPYQYAPVNKAGDASLGALSYLVGAAQYSIGANVGIKTSTTTAANTVTETTLYSYTFEANELQSGSRIIIEALGAYSNATAADDFTVKVKLGGSTLHTLARVGVNETNAGWIVRHAFTVRSVGAGGTIVDHASLADSENHIMAAEATTHTVDTTASNLFEITVTWANAKAGNTISCTQGSIRLER